MEAVYCRTHPLFPNRLTYPELFINEINTNHFYDNNDELVVKLTNLLNNKKFESLKSYTQQYDWSIIASKYDYILEKI